MVLDGGGGVLFPPSITQGLTWEKESQHIVGRKVENIKTFIFNEQNVHKKIISADNLPFNVISY